MEKLRALISQQAELNKQIEREVLEKVRDMIANPDAQKTLELSKLLHCQPVESPLLPIVDELGKYLDQK
ncbi:hypothetical protein [Pseudoalteromonas rubra]|uniref:Uncharacterized protein n=1 Tax=Pseudoalteromonas rubra TaxID=43658 RepID=A0A0F4QU57_9GAMM|nr:hypothetical protein [Pseudoalteromonas rubra]KJZ10765.1 hypothetical protein TW77_06950 [Pseudoalteromonas rubra]